MPCHAPQVLHHPLTLSYLGLSGLAGLALTYYYNNTENRKVGVGAGSLADGDAAWCMWFP